MSYVDVYFIPFKILLPQNNVSFEHTHDKNNKKVENNTVPSVCLQSH